MIGAGAGPAVRKQGAAIRRESAARETVELVDVGGLAPGSVTILSRLDLVESSVALMPRTRYAGSGGWTSAP